LHEAILKKDSISSFGTIQNQRMIWISTFQHRWLFWKPSDAAMVSLDSVLAQPMLLTMGKTSKPVSTKPDFNNLNIKEVDTLINQLKKEVQSLESRSQPGFLSLPKVKFKLWFEAQSNLKFFSDTVACLSSNSSPFNTGSMATSGG
jgi:hypothetical protein